ncbi:pitrilysin family protein [Streptomyces sp. NBC_01408]|uniref:M16 family metallopeptidase n=1 Tax=Streptomyces sp. NBC_01408 TaxID=2903855 RepID=UPI002252F32D|nr:insulinase family protein [Streptomyces sp. NBC_01408]MCX4691501.1 insulinase family protein [Streptomyces sp. NBC_01408]
MDIETTGPDTTAPAATGPDTTGRDITAPAATTPAAAADATTDADGVTQTTVDGIRTLLAPRSGPVTAGLLFRVGRADETLATSGITHLVEHLALHRHGLSDLHYNGATAATYTHFHVTGTPADVVEYLNGVCAALRDLPMDRLETEKEILRTEAAGRSRGPGHGMALWRYGSRSYGLTDYAEAGLHRITPHNVRDWAGTRFTAENAVLWITSDTLPEGLDLTLPTGEWLPAPEASSALPATPAYFRGDEGGMVLTSVLPRSTKAGLLAEILGKELFRALRQKGGYSYTAAAEYCPRDTDSATVVAYADALPEKQDAMVGAFVDVLAKLRAGRIEKADLEAVRTAALAQFDAPELAAAKLPAQAMNLLMRHRDLTVAEARAEIEAVTVADLHEVARELWAGALVQVPGRDLDWAGLTAAPTASSDTVTGRRYTSLEDRKVALLVGGDGVSLAGPDHQVTVRYAECSLMYVFPDGARHLVGHDGFTLTVEPTLHGITAAELAPLDAGVPPASVVRMPPRDPARIPQPRKAEPTAPKATRNTGITVVLWLLGLISGFLTVVLALLVVGETDAEITPAGPDWTSVIGFGVVCLMFVVPWLLVLRHRLKGKG